MSEMTDQSEVKVSTSRDENLIRKYVGRVNDDVKAGWRVGLMGKARCGKILIERLPPSILKREQKEEWYAGRDGAAKLLETRKTAFVGRSATGPMKIDRKGWPERWTVVNAMQKKGALGSVQVYYLQDGEIVREHDCMF